MTFTECFVTYDPELDSNLFKLSIDSIGKIMFSKSDNVATIRMIYVCENERRKGYATKLLKELSKRYTLEWDGRFTKDGRELYNSYCSSV